MATKQKIKLDKEEKDLLKSFESGELEPVENEREEMKLAEKAAARFLKKDARINIRISSYDLNRIRRIAANEGLSYQTLIASVLHKYAASRL